MIIGFCGVMGSGKGTCCDYMVEAKGFFKESFAKPVKDIVSIRYSMDRKMLEGDTEESRRDREKEDPFWSEQMGRPITPRYLMQHEGTNIGRAIHPDIWVLSLLKRVNPTFNYVVSDIRFPNEIRMIKEHGGKVFLVQRGLQEPDFITEARSRIQAGSFSPEDYIGGQHYSEWAWANESFDMKIYNNSSIEALHETLDKLVD